MIDLDEAPGQLLALDTDLKKRKIKWITSPGDFNAIRAVCEAWYRDYRPKIVSTVGELESVARVDTEFDWLRGRVGSKTDASKVRSALRTAARTVQREILPAYDTARWSDASEATLETSNTEIARRLRDVDPGLADSYEQATSDLESLNRKTYVGPAAELREVLRGAVDHLAAGGDAIKAEPWFKGHEGRPTQAERIRSILGSKDRAEQPAKALEIIDSAIGAVGRSTYNRASRSVHTSAHADREEVLRLRSWIDVVLAEILP